MTGSASALAALGVSLERTECIRAQQREDKNKLNALHAQVAECIAKVSCAVGYKTLADAGRNASGPRRLFVYPAFATLDDIVGQSVCRP